MVQAGSAIAGHVAGEQNSIGLWRGYCSNSAPTNKEACMNYFRYQKTGGIFKDTNHEDLCDNVMVSRLVSISAILVIRRNSQSHNDFPLVLWLR